MTGTPAANDHFHHQLPPSGERSRRVAGLLPKAEGVDRPGGGEASSARVEQNIPLAVLRITLPFAHEAARGSILTTINLIVYCIQCTRWYGRKPSLHPTGSEHEALGIIGFSSSKEGNRGDAMEHSLPCPNCGQVDDLETVNPLGIFMDRSVLWN